ncbi:DUF4178 domain-containing protein [Sphingomonas sanguinis]|uniref:DUF4178 domain-containing protein n=1 Tax=Sphingomonas sanguinis TaxID=33051 RepID=A0ABU5LR07_9SPHN|nr:DUF4178 domain-containing protein [Sphingomonas sanguinis]MDZ7282160.1 DUF4178 domain-containing protein [Sphingomonas sanguinis]
MDQPACPQCGAPVAFRSALPSRVCDYCRSLLVRDGEALRRVGQVAAVPDDVSPLQLGARGRFDGHRFELVGRVRWRWTDGAWNEWYAAVDTGGFWWLGEAMGRYMLLAAAGDDAKLASVWRKIAAGGTPSIGEQAEIAGADYRVTDVRHVECVASEGELPTPLPSGGQALSIDLTGSGGRCACIQRDGAEISLYTGRYVTLADIAATGLRRFDGWPMPDYAA